VVKVGIAHEALGEPVDLGPRRVVDDASLLAAVDDEHGRVLLSGLERRGLLLLRLAGGVLILPARLALGERFVERLVVGNAGRLGGVFHRRKGLGVERRCLVVELVVVELVGVVAHFAAFPAAYEIATTKLKPGVE
jgi:hypothetical protein